MVRHYIVFVAAFFALLIAVPAFAQTNDGIIGTVLEVEGSGSVTPAGGSEATPAAVNMPVHLNDVVQTAPSSRIFILFIDNTQLTLSENAHVSIDDYVFDPDDNTNNKAAYSVIQGAFQYVSGLIGKRENPDVHIETPVGSIGIRGTDFWAGNIDSQYGVAVNDGQVALKTDAGEEVVNKGEGTSVQDRHSIPAHAQAWPREKFERVASTVRLKRQGLVRRKMRGMQGRQRFLQRRYKNYMVRHRGKNYMAQHRAAGQKHQQLQRHEPQKQMRGGNRNHKQQMRAGRQKKQRQKNHPGQQRKHRQKGD